jgi:Pregnancy-associated plasma protein-A/Secretion system C-terminal sorting domain
MSKLIISISIFCSALLMNNKITAQSQNSQQCGFNNMVDYQESLYPGYKENVNTTYINLLEKVNGKKTQTSKMTYTIPVVFHVVWNASTPMQNLDDSVLIEQIAVLNEDFSRTNADASNIRPEFLPIVGNPDIQFQLACIDPNGNATNGIVRVQTSTTFGGGFLPDMASISQIQYSVSGGSDAWNTSEYLNIWVGDINGGGQASLLGIATPPAGLSNWPAGSIPPELTDGAIIQYNAFGRNNPNIFGGGVVINGRTVTHEVGHYLGVRHCAENTFGGLFGSICGDDDGLNDTPNCDQSAQGCDLSRNSCVDTIPGTTGDVADMVENYMDYSDQDCQNSFTQGQGLIMRSVLENERVLLLTSPGINNCTTGIDDNNLNASVSIYPNPSNGSFTIDLLDRDNVTITVLNNLGQEITPNTILITESKAELKIVKKGVYFITIRSEKNVTTQKIIIQ